MAVAFPHHGQQENTAPQPGKWPRLQVQAENEERLDGS
jgi:hypothetical protein